jgi:hypothetical protein
MGGIPKFISHSRLSYIDVGNRKLCYSVRHKNCSIPWLNIINLARAQRVVWLGHIERMPETRMVKAILPETHFKEAYRKTKYTLGG